MDFLETQDPERLDYFSDIFHTKAIFNLFTLRDPLESVVCYSHTFQNNFGIKQKFTKYLKESCCLTSL